MVGRASWCSYDYLNRTFGLPQGIDADNPKAKFKKAF
jgi:hypothetical protein